MKNSECEAVEFLEQIDVTFQGKTLIGIPYDAIHLNGGSSHGH